MSRSRRRKLRRDRHGWMVVPLASASLSGVGGAATDTEPVTLEEVVVTAQKLAQDLQKVPISVQVLSGDELDAHEVRSFTDYAKLLPGLSYKSLGPGQAQLYFRGLASGGDGLHAGSLPGTGVYLDEIPVSTIGNSLDVHMYDIARVEALAGPQGTLYGASSLSGTLRIITNKPDAAHFAAGYDIKATKFGRGDGGWAAEGFINIPLSDGMAVRLVGYHEHQGGYIDNLPTVATIGLGVPAAGIPNTPVNLSNAAAVRSRFNPVDTYGGRAAFKIDLDDSWTVIPQFIAQGQDARGSFAFDPKKGDLAIADYLIGDNRDRWYQSALTVEGKLSDFDVIYSGSWFERKVDNLVDYAGYTIGYDQAAQLPDATSSYVRFYEPDGSLLGNPLMYNANHDKYTKMSHELRVLSPQADRLRASIGLFYQRQSDDIRAEFRIDELPEYYAVDGSPNVYYLTQQVRVDRDYAVFADASYDITRRVTLSGGIRKFWVNNTLYGFFGYGLASGSTSGELSCNPPVSSATIVPNYWPCINTDKKAMENGETHRINLTYQVNDRRMVYVAYSTGYRPGGNNRRVGIAPYGADTLTNIEGGWKTGWFGNRLRLNGAVFYERWKALQLEVAGPQGIGSIVNVGDAAVKGVDVQLNWLASDYVTISAAATFIDARTLENFCNLDPATEAVTHDCADPPSPAGSRLPIAPRMKANATARYRFRLLGLDNFAQVSLAHQSSSTAYLSGSSPDILAKRPHFTTVDIALGTAKRNWTIEAYLENAFDERAVLSSYVQCVTNYCVDNSRIVPTTPMNFGIKFAQRF